MHPNIHRAAQACGNIGANVAEYLCLLRHNPPPGFVCEECHQIVIDLMDVLYDDILMTAAHPMLVDSGPIEIDGEMLDYDPAVLADASEAVAECVEFRAQQQRQVQAELNRPAA